MPSFTTDADVLAAYSSSFPDSPPGTRFYDPGYWNPTLGKWESGVDLRKSIGLNMLKAFDISSMPPGNTDRALIPLYVDPAIIDITRKHTPLVELIPRVTNLGRTAEFNRLTSRGQAAFQAEGDPLTEADDTYSRSSEAIKFLYIKGKVTGPAFAASLPYLRSGGYVDALNLEITNKTVSIREQEEFTILNGDATANPLSFNGIRTTITTNVQNLGGASIDVQHIRKAIRDARKGASSTPGTLGGGEPNLIVTDLETYDEIKALLQSQLRYTNIPMGQIAWGITTVLFDGIPIIPSKHMPRTNGQRELLVLDTRTMEMRVLQDLTYQELAVTADFRQFFLKIYETYINKAEEFSAKVVGIASP